MSAPSGTPLPLCQLLTQASPALRKCLRGHCRHSCPQAEGNSCSPSFYAVCLPTPCHPERCAEAGSPGPALSADCGRPLLLPRLPPAVLSMGETALHPCSPAASVPVSTGLSCTLSPSWEGHLRPRDPGHSAWRVPLCSWLLQALLRSTGSCLEYMR